MAQDKKESEVKYEVGSVVTGKVMGYPPWPGEVIDPDAAPSRVKQEHPMSRGRFYCVRFFPVGDHAWLPTKDVSRLLPQKIQSYLAEPSKRKDDLLEGYKIANDPHEWRKQKDALAQREKANEDAGISNANEDVDELSDEPSDEDEDEDKEAKARKRKRESEDNEDKTPDKPTSSELEKERPSKRAKKESVAPAPTAAGDDEPDDAAMANDPEAAKVKEWRHKLQRAFLAKTSPAAEEMAGLDTVFTTVEEYDKMTVEYLSYSKIGKVMRKIIQLPNIPSDDQFHFRQRAQELITKWQQLVTTSEDGNGKVASTFGKVKSTPNRVSGWWLSAGGGSRKRTKQTARKSGSGLPSRPARDADMLAHREGILNYRRGGKYPDQFWPISRT